MIKVRDIEASTEEAIKFLMALKSKQKELESKEKICYPKISLYTALKHNIFLTNLLMHPKVITEKNFFEQNYYTEGKEFKEVLGEVIKYELVSDQVYLTTEERDNIIKLFRKLEKREEKLAKEIEDI